MHSDNYRRISKFTLGLAGGVLLALLLNSQAALADNTNNANNTPTVAQTSSTATVRSLNDHQALPDHDHWQVPENSQNDVPVQFLGINDVHGNIDTTGRVFTNGLHQNAGEAARLAGYLNHAQDVFSKNNPGGHTFRLEAGDMVGASPATSSLLQDEPTMHALKAMGINIGTLGNHEFDEGLPEFHRILVGGKPRKGKFSKLEEDYHHIPAGIEMVESNLIDTRTGKPPYGWKPYLIKSVTDPINHQTVRVGFIGIETTDLPKLTFAKNLRHYKVTDEAQAIVKYAKILRGQGVNAIVVLAHTGAATYGKETAGDAVKIMQKVYQLDPNNSVDLFIAAHSHQYADAMVGKTHLVQAASFSKAYDDVTGYIDPKTDDFVALTSHVYPVMAANDPQPKESGVEIPPDAQVARIVKNAQEITAKITESTIARTKSGKAITKDFAPGSKAVGRNEMAVGDLVVDAQMAEAKKHHLKADLALTNGGGVRADLVTEKDGSIKWKSAQAVQPFANQIQVFKVKGKQIYGILNSQYAKNNENRYYLLSGMHYVYTAQNNANYPYKVAVVYDSHNRPVDPNKTYRVITSNYLVDSTPSFKGAKKVADLGIDTDLFVDYLKSQKVIPDPQMGRKQYLDPAAAAKLEAAAKSSTKPAATKKVFKLRHNAFVYNRRGRALRNRHRHLLIRKGKKIKGLKQGRIIKIRGKRFLQIGHQKYVKLANTYH